MYSNGLVQWKRKKLWDWKKSICFVVFPPAPVMVQRVILSHKPKREIAISFIISSHLYSQSQGVFFSCAPISYFPSQTLHSSSSASIFKSPIIPTLFTAFSLLFVPLLILLCLFFRCAVSFIHISVSLFLFLSLLPSSRVHFCSHFSSFSVSHCLSQ